MIVSEEVYLDHYFNDASNFMEHHGIRGQKWGIRNKRRTQNYVEVGKGKARPSQYARAAWNLGPIDLVKGRGIKGGAARKGTRQRTASENIAKGEASVRNILTRVASWRQQDLFPTSKSATNTKAAVGASVAGAILANIGYKILKSTIKKGIK